MRSFTTNEIWQPADISFGIWGGAIAQNIVRDQHMPVAFINTAVSGTVIASHAPGGYIFDKTLAILEKAKLNKVRGFFYFQGEEDASYGNTGPYYKEKFHELDSALLAELGVLSRSISFKFETCVLGMSLTEM